MLSSPHWNELESLIFDNPGLDNIRIKNWYFPTDYLIGSGGDLPQNAERLLGVAARSLREFFPQGTIEWQPAELHRLDRPTKTRAEGGFLI